MRYVHYTIGITTPPPEQEMRALAVWAAGTLGMVGVAIGFFFFLLAQFPAR